MSLGMYLTRHGEKREPKEYNFWHQLFYTIFVLWLLYMAGLPINF